MTEMHEGSDYQTIVQPTKVKFRQIASSLLLTSSLITSKHKINKLRQEQNDHSNQRGTPSALLTTNRVNI